MRVNRWWMLFLLLLMLVPCTLPVPARAQAEDDATAVAQSADPADDPSAERWWGVVGGVMCGFEIRLIRVAPQIGLNPYVMAAGLGGCLLALLDVMTTK